MSQKKGKKETRKEMCVSRAHKERKKEVGMCTQRMKDDEMEVLGSGRHTKGCVLGLRVWSLVSKRDNKWYLFHLGFYRVQEANVECRKQRPKYG